MKKGISTVIAIILILIIAVAIIALFYAWTIGIFKIAAISGEEEIETVTAKMQKSVAFTSTVCTNTTPTNNVIIWTLSATGAKNIEAGELSAYLDGIKITTTPEISEATIESGKTSGQFTRYVMNQKPLRTLKVSAPAGSIEEDLICPA